MIACKHDLIGSFLYGADSPSEQDEFAGEAAASLAVTVLAAPDDSLLGRTCGMNPNHLHD